MNENQKRLLISRMPAEEGLIYEAISDDESYKLQVNLTYIKTKQWKFITAIHGWMLDLQSSKDWTVAWTRLNTPDFEFSSTDASPRGRVREASFSKISKAIVEDESGRTLGWIDSGFKKDRLFLGDGREVGFVVRLRMRPLPLVLPPSKAYLLDRFEFIYDLAPDFDERLIYAWICRKVLAERNSSAG